MKSHPILKLIILLTLVAIIAFASLMLGFSYYSVTDIGNYLIHGQYNFVIADVRLPRLVMGALCGAMFALAGSIFQVIFRNQLASSETLGINAASILFVLFGITLYGSGNANILIYSVIGALAGFAITLFASISNHKISHLRLIVIGVAISALFRAGSQLMLIQQDQKLSAYISFVNGTLYATTWHSIHLIMLPALSLIILCLCWCKQLDILLLSDEIAENIGFKVTLWKILTIILALFLTSIAVAGVGSLGFIGLISPNISRLIFGHSHKYNLPGSGLIGIGLTILSDIIGRIILAPFEIPSGLVGIIIGVPYFLYIMRSMRQET